MDGTKVFIDKSDIRPAGTRVSVDLGYVGAAGRRIQRLTFDCSDHSIMPISSFGDQVETSADLAGDQPHDAGENSIFDYVCGSAKMPQASLAKLPEKAIGTTS